MIQFEVKSESIPMKVSNAVMIHGEDGKSAYEIAVEQGFEGSETEWLESLKGDTGEKGETGAKGEKGDRGEKGEKGEKGDTGDNYILTDADKKEIAEIISDNINDASVSESETWSSKNIIDRLCPAFEESGGIVTCDHPFEGYPLTVTAEDGTTITRTGRNVFGGIQLRDMLKSSDYGNYVVIDEGEKTVSFDPSGINRGIELFNKFKNNAAYTVILYGCNTIAGGGVTNLRIVYTDGTTEQFYFNNGKTGVNCKVNELGYVLHKTKSGKTPEKITASWQNGATLLYYDKCGVFEGDFSVEEFEAYMGASFEKGGNVPALQGVNNLWADKGQIAVAGRKDITAILDKLANAVVAAGSN